MSKFILRIVGVILLILIGIGIWAWVTIRSLEAVSVTDDVYVIYGIGGNATVLDTDAGTIVVDSMVLKMQGGLINDLARELTQDPVVMVINTHYHTDHTHGNPGFTIGTRIASTERTLAHLHTFDAAYWEGEAANFLPTETFTDTYEVQLGDKTIHLIHPGRGHTDGDLVVHFVEDDVITLGDLYFNHHYPNIDLEAGGTVQGWSDTIDTVLALPFTHVVPGHGDLSDRAGLQQFQQFMRQLAEVGREAAAANKSLEDTIRDAVLDTDAGYEPIFFAPGLDREFVITRAWEEATGAVKPVD